MQQQPPQRQKVAPPNSKIKSQKYTNTQSYQSKSMRNEVLLPFYLQQHEILKKINFQALHKYQTLHNFSKFQGIHTLRVHLT